MLFILKIKFASFQGRDLQSLIEQVFLEGKRQKFKFTTPWHDYNLFFHPNAMYQVNLKTGTKRQVKRRPDKLVAHEDVEDLKWYVNFVDIN